MTPLQKFSPDWWESMTIPEPNTGCLLWLGTVTRDGYGLVTIDRKRSPVLVHRLAYERAFGPFQYSLKVCHRCDTPCCMNPDHLFLATQRDNMRDMFRKGRGNPQGRVRSTTVTMPGRLAVTPRVSRTVLARGAQTSVEVVGILHLTRTNAMTAGWRRVTGVPASRPTRALVRVACPPDGTQKPSTEGTVGLAGGADVARYCRELKHGDEYGRSTAVRVSGSRRPALGAEQ